jgi:hypothetical protein
MHMMYYEGTLPKNAIHYVQETLIATTLYASPKVDWEWVLFVISALLVIVQVLIVRS